MHILPIWKLHANLEIVWHPVHNLKIVQFLLHAQYNNGQHSLWIIFSPLSHVMVLLVWQHCLCMNQNKTSHNLKIKLRDLRDLVPTELYTHLHVKHKDVYSFPRGSKSISSKDFYYKASSQSDCSLCISN